MSKNTNLRAEIISLTSTIQSEKRKNNFCQEKNNFLQSEIGSKNLTIKNKNSTIKANIKNATKKLEKQRVIYKEDRDNLLRYVIEQNEIANELSKTIQFMRAVISTSNPSLPSNTHTDTDATLLSSSPSLPSPLLFIKEELNVGVGRINTSQPDTRIAHTTVFSRVENLDDKHTDFNEISKQDDDVHGEKEDRDGEQDGEEKEGEEGGVEDQLVRKESDEKEILKEGNEDNEDENEEEGRGGDEGGSDDTGIEESKAQQRSVMLRSKLSID